MFGAQKQKRTLRNTTAFGLCIFLSLNPISAQAKNYIFFDGNSLVAGYPDNASATGGNTTFPNGTDFPSDVMKELGKDWIGYNVGISSRTLPQQNYDFDATVKPLIEKAKKDHAGRIIVINGGEPGNMMYATPGQGGPALQAAAYDALKEYATKVHNAGAEFLDITMPSRGFDGGADNNLQVDVQQVNRLIVKNCVRDHACDVVIDLAADPRMQRISNLRYYAAGSHFTAEGYKIWADYVVKGLKETSHLPLK